MSEKFLKIFYLEFGKKRKTWRKVNWLSKTYRSVPNSMTSQTWVHMTDAACVSGFCTSGADMHLVVEFAEVLVGMCEDQRVSAKKRVYVFRVWALKKLIWMQWACLKLLRFRQMSVFSCQLPSMGQCQHLPVDIILQRNHTQLSPLFLLLLMLYTFFLVLL